MDNIIAISYKYYNDALELIQNNKISDASKLLESAVRIYNKDIDILNLLGICEYMLCNFDKAHFYWNKSLDIDKVNNKAKGYIDIINGYEFQQMLNNYNLAIDNIQNNNFQDGINLFKKVIAYNNELIEPYYIIGLCYYELGNMPEANKYLRLAYKKDQKNVKYLEILNSVNDGETYGNENILNKKKTSNKLLVAAIGAILIVSGISLYQFNINYKKVANENRVYSEQLKKNKKENEKLVRELKEQIETYNVIAEDVKDKDLLYDINYSVFNNSVSKYRNKNYKEALVGFKNLINQSSQEIKSESTYFTAVCYEKLGEYVLAEKYYSFYIKDYKKDNYYDDAMYNYGMMMYKQNEIDKSRKILAKLKEDEPKSIFVNSIVKTILSN